MKGDNKPQSLAPQYYPEPQAKSAESLDLLGQVESEDWLAERLKSHGCDIYVDGTYATYIDRLGECIVRNGMQAVVAGGGPDGRPETYAHCYQRLYGKALPKLAPKTIVGGQHDTLTTTTSRVPPVHRASDAAAPSGAIGGKTRR